MKKTYFIVSSITYASKARDILNYNGYKVRLENTPQHLKKRGCSQSVVVYENADRAEKLLQKYGIKILDRIDTDDLS